MKIVRVARAEETSYGVLRDGEIHLTHGLPTESPCWTGEAISAGSAPLLVPIEPTKIFGVGRNYADHIAEMGYARPARPSLFMKPPTALLAPGGTVVLPAPELSTSVEHEAELAVVIGRRGRHISVEEARRYVLGYTCANDVSARDLQRSDDSAIRGKGFDTFCPVGPWIETDVDLDAGVTIQCRVNGELRQSGQTSQLIFDIPYLISYLSAFATLLPGDLILTGSPGGSGSMKPGDDVEVDLSQIGVLRHVVASYRSDR